MLLLALAVLACLGCLGCASELSVDLPRWELLVPGQPPVPVTLPGKLPLPDRPLEFTLRADVELPVAMRGNPVSVTIAETLTPGALRVDGVTPLPCVDPTFETYRTNGALCWHFVAPQAATLHMELAMRHTSTVTGAIGTAPALVASPDGGVKLRQQFLFNRSTQVGTVTVAWLLGSLYLLAYLRDRTRRAHLWFTLEALGAGIYPLFWLGPSQVLGVADRWFIADTTCLACLASLYFTHAQLGLGPVPRVWRALVGLGVVMGFAQVLPFPPVALAFGTAAVIGAGTLAQVYVCLRAVGRPGDRVVPAVIGLTWIAILIAAPFDVPALVGMPTPGGGLHPMSLALGVVGVGQGALLAREHVTSLLDADRLNAELRRQIAERSRELADALALHAAQADGERLRPDDVVNGRYRVVRKLGEGGMGEVYEVERLSDQRRLALKLVLGTATKDQLARLAREAQIAAKITHPNLVAIADVDFADSRGLFLVMELVEGGSLAERRARYGDVPWARQVLRQVSEGLAALHEAGVVHRDLKPANVLVDPADTIAKICDFGIATLDERPGVLDDTVEGSDPTLSAVRLTRTGIVLGTPQYMAPELAGGARMATSAADMFALGILGYELLGLGYPFTAPPVVDAIYGRENSRRRLLTTQRVGDDLTELLDACLEAEPSRRPSARAVAERLTRAA
jgi:predicted Ser/Thr protein kinase